MSHTLQGRTLLVTGAASGIGRAIAELASEGGANLVLVDIEPEFLHTLADQVGGEAHVMDVGDALAWRELCGKTSDWDFVCLNAGVMSAPPDAPIEASDFLTLDLDQYRRVLSVNIDGVAFGLRAALPRMKDRGGAVVVTASAAGLVPYPLDATYALTKHALIGLVRSVAATLNNGAASSGSPTIRLSAICPGGVQTALLPTMLRGAPVIMEPSVIADEILDLCLHGENGEVRVRIRKDEPAKRFDARKLEP